MRGGYTASPESLARARRALVHFGSYENIRRNSFHLPNGEYVSQSRAKKFDDWDRDEEELKVIEIRRQKALLREKEKKEKEEKEKELLLEQEKKKAAVTGA